MKPQEESISILDAIAVVSFFLGLANYDENVNQSDVQKTVNSAVMDIHDHLTVQDRRLGLIEQKLDKILSLRKEENLKNEKPYAGRV